MVSPSGCRGQGRGFESHSGQNRFVGSPVPNRFVGFAQPVCRFVQPARRFAESPKRHVGSSVRLFRRFFASERACWQVFSSALKSWAQAGFQLGAEKLRETDKRGRSAEAAATKYGQAAQVHRRCASREPAARPIKAVPPSRDAFFIWAP